MAWLQTRKRDAAADAGFRQGRGCDRCNKTGYQGRIGVYELLEMRGDLLVALRNQDIDGFAAAAAADESFRPIARTALDLALAGRTSLAEVIRISGEGDH